MMRAVIRYEWAWRVAAAAFLACGCAEAVLLTRFMSARASLLTAEVLYHALALSPLPAWALGRCALRQGARHESVRSTRAGESRGDPYRHVRPGTASLMSGPFPWWSVHLACWNAIATGLLLSVWQGALYCITVRLVLDVLWFSYWLRDVRRAGVLERFQSDSGMPGLLLRTRRGVRSVDLTGFDHRAMTLELRVNGTREVWKAVGGIGAVVREAQPAGAPGQRGTPPDGDARREAWHMAQREFRRAWRWTTILPMLALPCLVMWVGASHTATLLQWGPTIQMVALAFLPFAGWFVAREAALKASPAGKCWIVTEPLPRWALWPSVWCAALVGLPSAFLGGYFSWLFPLAALLLSTVLLFHVGWILMVLFSAPRLALLERTSSGELWMHHSTGSEVVTLRGIAAERAEIDIARGLSDRERWALEVWRGVSSVDALVRDESR